MIPYPGASPRQEKYRWFQSDATLFYFILIMLYYRHFQIYSTMWCTPHIAIQVGSQIAASRTEAITLSVLKERRLAGAVCCIRGTGWGVHVQGTAGAELGGG